MELEIIRTYYPNGTNGILYFKGSLQCYTIELPWRNNAHGISCIPEGKYELKERYSKKFGAHFLVDNVKDRSDILIHPANDALKELKGCIAPVSILTGEGRGEQSRLALENMKRILYKAMQSEKVYLTIEKYNYEYN